MTLIVSHESGKKDMEWPSSTAYPPLIHPIKSPLNRRILLDTSNEKKGKLLTGKQANFWREHKQTSGKVQDTNDIVSEW